MIEISPSITLPEDEIVLNFVRASGPGGQNVNKVASAVQLRFDIDHSPSLPADVKFRLKKLVGKRLSDEGFLVIEAKRFRSQEKNREDAILRFIFLVRKATEIPKKRTKTVPTKASRIRRVDSKRRDSAKKEFRKKVRIED